MAKRGYRGKHPHNDMKVSNPSSGKYSAKLTTEYNKLGSKQKYPYIQSNYFYPQASFTISSSLDLTNDSQFTMSAWDGTVVELGGAGSTSNANHTFKADGTAAQASDGIVQVVNYISSSHFTASSAGDVVTVKQLEPGPDGNTAITFNSIAPTVGINGVSSSAAGGSKFTGG